MHHLTVTYDNGTTEDVEAGQREMAEFELQPFGGSSLEALTVKPMVYMRFIAWAALRRQERLPKKGIPYQAWDETVDTVIKATKQTADALAKKNVPQYLTLAILAIVALVGGASIFFWKKKSATDGQAKRGKTTMGYPKG